MLGPMETVSQTRWIPGVVASLPTVKGLGRDIKVAAGKTGIVTTGVIVIKPFKSLPGFL